MYMYLEPATSKIYIEEISGICWGLRHMVYSLLHYYYNHVQCVIVSRTLLLQTLHFTAAIQ
jgi:hypothetical protein